MTNHWADIDNTSLIVVMGANPSENHPACMGHINAARYGSKNARLIVIDPRKTRTAAVADMFVRIRPGTDIAFLNGLLNYILTGVDGGTLNATFSTNLKAWHNGLNTNHLSAGRTFVDDAGVTRTLTSAELMGAKYDDIATGAFTTAPGPAAGWPKYCDSRLQVDTSGAFVDYKRGVLTTKSYNPANSTTAWKFSNMPVLMPTVDSANTVWNKLKAHVANYSLAETADICGCTQAEIVAVANEFIANSRMMSSDFSASASTPTNAAYKATTVLYAMGQTQHTYGSQNIRDLAVVQTLLGNMGRPGGGINALRGIHNVQGSTDFANLYDGIPGYSGNPGASYDAYVDGLFGNRTLSTAPGAGDRYEPRKLGLQQRGFYNMTTQWFGATGAGTSAVATYTVEAAKSVNLASMSVDMGTVVVRSAAGGGGTLFADGVDYTMGYGSATVLGSITRVAYKAIPDASTVYVSYTHHSGTVVTDEAVAFPAAAATTSAVGGTIALKDVWLKPTTLTLTGSTSGALVEGTDFSVDSQTGVVTRLGGAIVNGETFTAAYDKWAKRADAEFEGLYALWPKGNGLDHISAFRAMGSGYAGTDNIKALVCWGQNPAVTEPNQSFVRAGLENLDLLVVTDLFETETAGCKRKASGVTYLLPACSHVEEAGSVTNSGRWLQWRDRARAPHGNSKADLELLLRLSKALATAGAFSHIAAKWTAAVPSVTGDVWDVLYGKYCPGWDGLSATGFELLEFTDTDRGYGTVYGSEAVAENIFKEICRPLDDATVGAGGGGVMWIYSGAGSASAYNTIKGNVSPTIAGYDGTVGAAWSTVNRAKSRDSSFAGIANNYPRYGWAWLLNRRVFYNNSEVTNDVADVFVAPGVIARLMTFDYKNTNTKANWSLLYRAYNTVKDAPSVTGGPHAAGLPGNFPAYCEPIETPRRDLAAKYGRNTMLTSTAGASTTTVKTDSNVALWSSDPAEAAYTDAKYSGATGNWGADAAEFPLVLTSIRCVEHFQGGPITRNNSWNVEAEPVPWVEINSTDARKYGIVDGQWVNVVTARGNSTSDQEANTVGTPAGWARGFKARVGVGLQSNQRVAPGVVAIPWHWGDKGLSTGSRANDLCIDAFDANTQIPEYKACLCKIVGL